MTSQFSIIANESLNNYFLISNQAISGSVTRVAKKRLPKVSLGKRGCLGAPAIFSPDCCRQLAVCDVSEAVALSEHTHISWRLTGFPGHHPAPAFV